MNQQEKFMDDIENKKGNYLSDFASKVYLQTLHRTPSDIGHQVEFTENISSNKENQFHENSNDSFCNDEESMIPKGLLDQPYDKTEEHYYNEVTTSNPTLHYGVPCYIALFPHPAERPIMPNYHHLNGSPPYFPSDPACLYPTGNDFVMQHQRDLRTFNNLQYNRNYQGMDYNWWGQCRQNHFSYIPNSNLERIPPTMQRNIGLPVADRFYDPQQIIHEHPYECNQRDLGHKAHFSYGYDNNYTSTACPLQSYTKSFCRNQNKFKREFQQTQDGTMIFRNNYCHDVLVPSNINYGVSSINLTSKHDEAHRNAADQENFMSYLNTYYSKCKSNELNTFKKIALEGCQQLERLLATYNCKSSAKNLEELCRSVKNQLSHSINIVQSELLMRELILGFLHICNSWICISSILAMKQGQATNHENNIQALHVDFEEWQNTSKTLLMKLLVAVQEMSQEHECSKGIYKCTDNSKPLKEFEGVNNDLDEIKTDVLNKESKQTMKNVPNILSSNESFNFKQSTIQSSESENNVSLDNGISFTLDSSTECRDFQDYKENYISSINTNRTQEFLNAKHICYNSRSMFPSVTSENINAVNNNIDIEQNIATEENKIAYTEKEKSIFPFIKKKNHAMSKQELASYASNKDISSFSFDNFSFNNESSQSSILIGQSETLNKQDTELKKFNLKSDSTWSYEIPVQPEGKHKEKEDKEFMNRTTNGVNQNSQFSNDRYNSKYTRKKSLKNKICNFSKNYNKPLENGLYTEQIINIKSYSKSKLQDIFSAIQGTELEKLIPQRRIDGDAI